MRQGIIKETNKDNLVAGVTMLRELHNWWAEDYLYGEDAIDLTYEEYKAELVAEGKTDEEIEEELDFYEPDCVTILFGDWYQDPKDNLYKIDKEGHNGFAGTYSNSYGDHITIEWSKWSVPCHHTSPCYVMSDGRPCGDLDTEGDSVEAYCLPEDHWRELEYDSNVEKLLMESQEESTET
jgi:hypothetical protein